MWLLYKRKYEMNAKIRLASIVLAVLGITVSAYLTAYHYFSSIPLACSTKGLINCANVLHSKIRDVDGPSCRSIRRNLLRNRAVTVVYKPRRAFIYLQCAWNRLRHLSSLRRINGREHMRVLHLGPHNRGHTIYPINIQHFSSELTTTESAILLCNRLSSYLRRWCL